jgi:hypothetical protein
VKQKLSEAPAADTQITPHVSPPSTAIKSAARQAADVPVHLPEVRSRGAVQAWLHFWFIPVDATGLHALRLLCGLLFALWLLLLAGHQVAFFSLSGWLDVLAYKQAAQLPGGPPAPFGWSILYLCGTDETLVNTVYWCSIGVLLLFAAGVATRITSVLTWVIVVSFTANPVLRYDADSLLVVLAFYLMVAYVLLGQWSRSLVPLERAIGSTEGGILALFRRKPAGQAQPTPSYAANLAIRLLQVHFALIMVTAGLHKLQSSDWWSGVAFWYPMHPPLTTTFDSIKGTTLHTGQAILMALSLGAYATLAWQLCFPLFAWRRGWGRFVLLGGAALGWAGSIFIWQLPLFGPVFAIMSLAYLTPDEWHRLIDQLQRWGCGLTGRLQRASAAGVTKPSKSLAQKGA